MQHYADLGWQPLMLVALAGAVLILFGIVLTVAQLVISIRTREHHRDLTGDPWGGRTLEWSIPSPPPAWNFAVLPTVNGTDAYWAMKQMGIQPLGADADAYHAIEIPRSNPTGVFLAFFSVGWGFAMIWHIWWLSILGILGCIAVGLVQAWRVDNETMFSAEEVAAVERARLGEEIPA
jgi:cytochrome o ubiquinol oxidase subunit 1